MSRAESKYIEKKAYLSRYTHERILALREAEAPASGWGDEAAWARFLKREAKKFIPFLTEKCGLEFRGRILEIGAGAAWLSAELSKLAKVVEGFREQQQDGTVTVPDAFYDRYVTSLETLLKLKSESADHAVIEKFLCQVLAAEREAFDMQR